MGNIEEIGESQSHFDKGLLYAIDYYKSKGVWDVDFKLKYKEFNLGAWWTSTKRSILLGTLQDVQVKSLIDSNVDFGVQPLYYKQWFELIRVWKENNGEYPAEQSIQDNYCIGKWYKRNRKKLEKTSGCSDKNTEVEMDKTDILELDKVWGKKYVKFSVAWKAAQRGELSEEEGYTQSIYMWGLKQIEQMPQLEKWKVDKLNEVGMLWEKEEYEKIFSPWLLKFFDFKNMYFADAQQIEEDYTIGKMQKFVWAERQLKSEIEKWKMEKFRDIGIDTLYELRIAENEKRRLIQDATYQKKMKALNESRLKGTEEGIVSIKVIGKQIDYVRNNVINATQECDYYEVRIQLCSTLDEESFKEYVTVNKQRFLECGKRAIIEKQTKKYVVPLPQNLKVDKMVYGLKSHMVTIMFSIH